MRRKDIERFGSTLFSQSIHSLKRIKTVSSPIIKAFKPASSAEDLNQKVRSDTTIKKDQTVYVPVFSSLKNIIGWKLDRNTYIREWRPGCYDITYKSGSECLRIIDLGHWFNCSKEEAFELFECKTEKDLFDRLHTYMKDLFGVDIIAYRTPASASMAHFRANYVTEDIENHNVMIRRMALRCAHGNAIQNYFRGKRAGTIFHYDAFSQHPQCAIAMKRLPKEKDWQRYESEKISDQVLGGLFDVHFSFPKDCIYPCLPVESKNRQMIFPLEGQSHCTLEEIRLALEMNADITIHFGFVYYSGTDCLPRYMADLLKKRKSLKSEPEKFLYKILMNGLIGKLFEKFQRVDINANIKRAANLGMTTEEYFAIVGQQAADTRLGFVRSQTAVGTGYYPEWYSLILGHSRASVLECAWRNDALCAIGDGVICMNPIEKDNYRGVRYDLKKQGSSFTTYREGLYCLDTITACSGGVKNHMDSAFTSKEDTFEFEFKKSAKLKEALKKGQKIGSTVTERRAVSLKWSGRGHVLEDGTVIPLERC